MLAVHRIKAPANLYYYSHLEHIENERERIRTAIVSRARLFITELLNRAHESYRAGLHEKTCRNPACIDMAIGSIVRSTYENDLSFLITKNLPAPLAMTITDLQNAIEKLQLRTLYWTDAEFHRVAHGRNPKFDHTRLELNKEQQYLVSYSHKPEVLPAPIQSPFAGFNSCKTTSLFDPPSYCMTMLTRDQ